jgi:flagellar hook-associated protein 2
VTATIISDASGARLALRSSASGAANGFRIGAVETVDDGVAANGLSALAWDPAGASQLTLSQSAGDAQASINGIPVTSTSNTLTNVSDGVTLQLLRPTTAAVSVGVSTDTVSIKTAVQDFVTSFNALASFIQTQTKYDPNTKTAGAMQGDSLVVGLQRQLRATLNQASSASTSFTRLSDIGITMASDGTLSVTGSKLDNGLANLPELRKLLAAAGTGTADSGFMSRYKALGDALLGANGAFQTRTDSLQSRLKDNSTQQSQLQARLTQTEQRLRAQYTALDANMGQLNGLSSYVTQQMTALNNFYTATANKGN